MTKPPLNVIIIAGPNGAGKSTTAPDLLQKTLQVVEYVNADTIAAGLSAFQPEKAALQAGRIMLNRLRQLAGERANFAFETTLASRTFAPWIADLRQQGYRFHLVFLWLPSPDFARIRVDERVYQGGHDIPEATIHRRYHRGLSNFFQLYRPLADVWHFYDNSNPAGARIIASGIRDIQETIHDAETWERITGEFNR